VLDSLRGVPFANSKEEMEALFKRFDKNNDGVLDWDEVWESMKPLQKLLAAKKFDWKMDPQTTVEDFEKNVKEMFKSADITQTNYLEVKEFEQFGEYFFSSVKDMKLFSKEFDVAEIFKTFDKDGDGRLDWDDIWEKMFPICAKIKAKKFHWVCPPNIKQTDFRNMVKEMYKCADENKNDILEHGEFEIFSRFVCNSMEDCPNLVNTLAAFTQLFEELGEGNEDLDWKEVWHSMKYTV
jgi:Ca2+-binding EF-hand superfamily protein